MNSAVTLEDSFMASYKSHILLLEDPAIDTPWYWYIEEYIPVKICKCISGAVSLMIGKVNG